MSQASKDFNVIEVCAGAGGQALGLHMAHFEHEVAIELDPNACETLRKNLPEGVVIENDVADTDSWNRDKYTPGKETFEKRIDLLAGGVPCPPFTVAGKQLGADDERDLFAWAVEQAGIMQPRALLLENVRGLSMPRFAGYRQHVLDRLTDFGYVAEWRLLYASDFGVPQLRPRFVLVAMKEEDAKHFIWPEDPKPELTVGTALKDLMGANGWRHLDKWVAGAQKIAPTIVGGSKKHGGADLGPTRAKRAWGELWVDGHGVADAPPGPTDNPERGPKLTCEMVARIQGWSEEYPWEFTGRKTSRYRQIGNAFPPPMAHQIGAAIASAFNGDSLAEERKISTHDAIYKKLREARGEYVAAKDLIKAGSLNKGIAELESRITLLRRDFDVESTLNKGETLYKLEKFKAFIGQQDHGRHEKFLKNRAKIS